MPGRTCTSRASDPRIRAWPLPHSPRPAGRRRARNRAASASGFSWQVVRTRPPGTEPGPPLLWHRGRIFGQVDRGSAELIRLPAGHIRDGASGPPLERGVDRPSRFARCPSAPGFGGGARQNRARVRPLARQTWNRRRKRFQRAAASSGLRRFQLVDQMAGPSSRARSTRPAEPPLGMRRSRSWN